MKLSIVIPAYNEELRIRPTLESYSALFEEWLGDGFELIVVVNHCTDGTKQVVREVMLTCPRIRLISEQNRIGKGGAVELGMRQAKGELIGFVDADGATPADSFRELVEQIGECGCIIGSRWIQGAEVHPRQSLLRRLASRVLNRIVVHAMFGLKVYDSQCGAKLFQRDVLEKILPEVVEPGWAFDIDLLYRVKRLGYGIREYPVKWHHVAGNPTVFLLMGLQMLVSVARVRKNLFRT